jgi:hypothetical protein
LPGITENLPGKCFSGDIFKPITTTRRRAYYVERI